MSTTQAQQEAYWLQRLDPYRIRHSKGNSYRSQCPFHGGNNVTALWIDLESGGYRCFACGEHGKGIGTFEQKMQKAESKVDLPFVEAQKAALEVAGTPFEQRVYPEPIREHKEGAGWDRRLAQARYVYTDELGAEIFSVWRFVDRHGDKKTPPDHPCPCSSDSACEACQGVGRVWGRAGCRNVPYRLPDVIQALWVFIVEGEKNANDLSRALGSYIAKQGEVSLGALTVDRIAVTTNAGGASGWKKEFDFGKWFRGKVVIKLSDNDAAGRCHEQDVCSDVAQYAKELFTLPLPVGEGQDVSDFLAHKSVEDLLKLLPNRVRWETKEQITSVTRTEPVERVLLVPPSKLACNADGIDWLVHRLIPRHKRGLVIAPPKTGKSFFFLDLALALATMKPVLGRNSVGRPFRVAIVSREDGPDLVASRLQALAKGRQIGWDEVDKNILVNTTAQSSRFRIDIDADLKEMANWLKAARIDFTVIDVLNKLHRGEENSSTDMTAIMNKFDDLSRLSGSDVCVIHHSSKSGGARGSSSIEGWADYIFKLEADPTNDAVKTLQVRTKASAQPMVQRMRYWQSEDLKSSRIELLLNGSSGS